MYFAKKHLNQIIFGGVGLVVGFVAGYIVAKKREQDKAEEEIFELRQHYIKQLQKTRKICKDINEAVEEVAAETTLKTQKAREQAQTIIVDNGYGEVEVEVEVEDEIPTIVNVFGDTIETDEETSEFDQNGEFYSLKAKSSGLPYIISYEQYNEEYEGEYEKDTLEWYAQDSTLCDSRDEMVDDVDKRIGYDNLDFFGWRSYAENVVYVRNDDLGIDFEITFNPGAYAMIVLGDVEIDDPRAPKIRKMRDE